MIIVHVINSLAVGGTAKVVVDICNNINLQANRVYVIVFSNKDLTLTKKLNEGIEVICLPFKNNNFFDIIIFWLLGLPKLLKIINQIKPDIVHSHIYYHYLLFVSIVLKLSNVKPKYFRTVHTSGLFYSSKTLLNKFRCKIEKIALILYPTSVISISNAIFQNNNRLFNKILLNNRLISNGINLANFSKSNYKGIKKVDFGLNEEWIVVSYVARLDYGKNHICLFNAWSEIVKLYPNTHLCLAGDGVLKNDLMYHLKLLGIEKKVSFLGTINNVAELLSITDIAIFPSQFEGFPISLIEEMAMGLPVITSDIDVFKEVIIDNENGLICRVNDSLDYVNKLSILILNCDLRIKISERAKETAKKFDINTVVNETLSYYEEVLSI